MRKCDFICWLWQKGDECKRSWNVKETTQRCMRIEKTCLEIENNNRWTIQMEDKLTVLLSKPIINRKLYSIKWHVNHVSVVIFFSWVVQKPIVHKTLEFQNVSVRKVLKSISLLDEHTNMCTTDKSISSRWQSVDFIDWQKGRNLMFVRMKNDCDLK